MHRFREILPVACLLGFLAGQPVEGADFQKSYALGPGSGIKIENVSGNIVVSGYDGSTVQVKGIKEGRDKDRVEVEDASDSKNLNLKVRYPQNCHCDASIRFEVQVPRSVSFKFERLSTASWDIEVHDATGDFRIHSASGNLHVQNVAGVVHANTASGDVTVTQVEGSVNADSASGDIAVEITKLEGNDHGMKVTTASGNVTVKLPPNPDVEVEISTVSGSVHTDFPIQVHTPEYGPFRLMNWVWELVGSVLSGRMRSREF